MNSGDLDKRLTRLETARRTAPIRLTPAQAADAARRYEAALHEDDPRTPEAEAYFATATLHQLASDYAEMCRGAPTPWE